MASGGGGVGRGRGRGAGSGGHAAPALGAVIPARECESCRSAPGIPFCRVEWSFLCAGCASVVHGQSWIVAVPPSANSGANMTPLPGAYSVPYAYQHPFPPNPSPSPSPSLNPNPAIVPLTCPQPNPSPIPSENPNHVVQLSSDEDEQSAGDPGEDDDGSVGRKRQRPSSEGESAGPGREASVMRYKEKRKSRNFDKAIRYESRKAHAETKPRLGGKFVKTGDDVSGEVEDSVGVGDIGAGEGEIDSGGDGIRANSSAEVRVNTDAESADPSKQLKVLDPGDMVAASPSFEVVQFDGGVDLVQMDTAEEVGLL